MKIVLPKTQCDVDPQYGPLFFLAGPVLGGDDWQTRGCVEIEKWIPNFYAAIPCRHGEDHPLFSSTVSSNEKGFDRQLSWERYYLSLAAHAGCLIFWLPSESKTNPRSDGNPYAMDTRGELGEWRGQLMDNPYLRIVVGAEPTFPGLSQIQRNFNEATNSHFKIYGTLDETVAAAVKKVM